MAPKASMKSPSTPPWPPTRAVRPVRWVRDHVAQVVDRGRDDLAVGAEQIGTTTCAAVPSSEYCGAADPLGVDVVDLAELAGVVLDRGLVVGGQPTLALEDDRRAGSSRSP